jgi:hypothetical protein
MDEITALDYILLPFYLLVIYKIAYHYRNKYYPLDHPFRPYFIPALTAKIAGAIFIGLIYYYYYGGGDTFAYFFHTKIINSTLPDSPSTWLRLITHNANESVPADAQALSDMYWYDDPPTYTTSCLGAFIGIFCFTKYLVINVIIASISFIGMWLMFITFAVQYKSIIKYVALAILFMPGTIVWGSGLFKDSFCMFSVGSLVYCIYILFEKKVFKFGLFLLGAISILLLLLIKAYILLVLLPALILKAILFYKKEVAKHPEKKVVFYFILALFILAAFRISSMAMGYVSKFNVDNVLETVEKQKNYLLSVSIAQDGAAYDLGDFEPSINGILKMTFPAINVALFRPYPWESRSVIQLFNALESTGVLLLTLYLLLKRNIFKTLRKIFDDPNLVTCLIFSMIFAFIVGISSYNFGSLSRYKIPCTPFYMLFLMVLIFDNSNAPINDTVVESSK